MAPQRPEQPAPAAQPVSTPSRDRTPPKDVGSDTFDPADPPASTKDEAAEDRTEAEAPQDEPTEPPEAEPGPEATAPEPPPTSTAGSNGSTTPDAEEAAPPPAKEEAEADEPPPPPPPPAVTASPGAADRTFSLIQDSRASADLAALQRHAGADGVAQAWAEHMAADGVLSHNPDFATQLWSAVGSGAVAENIGTIRPADPAALHQQFMGSASHKANILGSYTYVGVGAATDGEGGLWVVHTFVEPA